MKSLEYRVWYTTSQANRQQLSNGSNTVFCGVKYDKTLNHIVVAMLNRILSYLPSKTSKILAL